MRTHIIEVFFLAFLGVFCYGIVKQANDLVFADNMAVNSIEMNNPGSNDATDLPENFDTNTKENTTALTENNTINNNMADTDPVGTTANIDSGSPVTAPESGVTSPSPTPNGSGSIENASVNSIGVNTSSTGTTTTGSGSASATASSGVGQ